MKIYTSSKGLCQISQTIKVWVSFSFPNLRANVICPFGVILFPLADKNFITVDGVHITFCLNVSKQDLLITDLEAPVLHSFDISLPFIVV